jgi:hypothetical protein
MKIVVEESFEDTFKSDNPVNTYGFRVVENNVVSRYKKLPLGQVFYKCTASIKSSGSCPQTAQSGETFYGKVSGTEPATDVVKNTRQYALAYLKSSIVHAIDAMIENNVVANNELPRSYDSFEYNETRNCTFVDIPAEKVAE